MIRLGLLKARDLGHKAVLLVGDAPYYERFGFSRVGAENLDLPGPVDLARFLALELQPGALAGAKGLVRATGDFDRRARGFATRGVKSVVRLTYKPSKMLRCRKTGSFGLTPFLAFARKPANFSCPG